MWPAYLCYAAAAAMLCRLLIAVALLAAAARAAGTPGPAVLPPEQLAFFEAKVRPILIEHCHRCHSAGSEKLKANLRLDSRDAALRGGDSGPAVVPGDPEASLLIKAIRYHDGDLQMPPKNKLPAPIVADLTLWVKMGAAWPGPVEKPPKGGDGASGPDYEALRKSHWAYQPLAHPVPPDVAGAAWPRDDVDRFVLARLESRSLAPVADADRLTLVRRIYFDLLGLPPRPGEIDAFLADASPDAVARLVDRLLASPHFGERWGRHWLDVARYADSTGGGRSQVLEDAWRYRDYVVASYNADKRFADFAAEQIAGDLIAPDSPDALVATGFLALGPKNLDAQDKDLLRMDVVDEQVDTIGRAFLGLSVGCARCHDHKFEPIPTAEYYALAGILRSTKTLLPGNVSGFVRRPLPGLDPHRQRRAAHNARVKAAREHLDSARAELKKVDPAAGAAKAGGSRDAESFPGVVVDDTAARSTGVWKTSTFHKSYVGTGYLHDDNAGKGEKSVDFAAELPSAGEYEVRLSYAPGGGRAANVPVTVRHAGGETVVRVDQGKAPPLDGLFVSLGTFGFNGGPGGASVVVSNGGTSGHVTVDAVQFLPATPPAAANPPSNAKRDVTRAAVVELRARITNLESELEQLAKSSPPPAPMALAVQDEDPGEIADCRINVRGNNHNLGAVVPRGFLSVATVSTPPPVDPGQSGRRELAEWLTRPDNPLTARVYVNRVWHHLFGAGLVRTPDDFGVTGETPSHPELLDYLAASFLRDGGSTKKLVRRIVLSRTYQIATTPDAKARAVDPENRLLWRMNRRRLDAESFRDAVLHVSGRLDFSVGGPTVRPDASEFEYRFDTVRRSVYIPVFRYSPHEMMEVFDFPDPNLVAGRRASSILATQALFLMNSPFMLEQSRGAAKRLLAVPNIDDAARIELAYRQALGRPPTAAERAFALMHVGAAPADGAGDGGVESFAGLYQALFSSLEFRYIN